jgi:lipoprotein-releasing system permease protein
MMVHIATAAVAVSIAVAVISLSVIFGFKEQISSLVTAITSDVTIANPRSQRQPELYPINDNDTLRSIISST